jgi:hypothetical protein
MYTTSREESIITGQPITARMSVTSTDVINAYNTFLNEIAQPETAASLQAVEEVQHKNEEKLITSGSICGVPMLNSLRDRLGGLKAAQLKEMAIRQFYNPDVMQATLCAVDSIFYSSPYDIGSLYLNNRIRTYLHNLRQVGPETAEGYMMIADFENAKDMFMIETARSPVNDPLLHKLIVTLYGTNKLRDQIPNFVYYYGGFKCSPPLIDPETKQVVTWCLHDDNPVNYVLLENIGPVITMSKYIETCTGTEFVNVYMQVLYALRFALKEIDFTHYDLHYENVVLREPHLKHPHIQAAEPATKRPDCVPISSSRTTKGECPAGTKKKEPNPFQIKYETERGIEYITTTYIPTIIDFSYAHIKTNEIKDSSGTVFMPIQHFGRNGFVPFSIFSYRSWIMHDLYKFLMFCMLAASRAENESVMKEAIKIFRFFNHVENPIVALEEQWPTRYAFPLTAETNALTINDLAIYIRTACDCSFISFSKSSLPSLDCESMCLKKDDVFSRIGMNPTGPLGTPDNVIEFYDISIRLQNENRDQEKNTLAQNFPYERAIKTHINKMNLQVREITDLRRKLKLVDIGQMTVDQVLQYNTMMIVRSMYISIGAIIDKTVDLRFYRDIGVAVAKSYGDANTAKTIEDIVINFDKDIRPSLEDAKRVFGNNHAYLNRIETDEIVQISLKRDERLRWYWDGRKLFDVVFGRVTVEKPMETKELVLVRTVTTTMTTTTE